MMDEDATLPDDATADVHDDDINTPEPDALPDATATTADAPSAPPPPPPHEPNPAGVLDFIYEENAEPERADKALAARSGLSRTRVQRLLSDGHGLINRADAEPRRLDSKFRLCPGDHIRLHIPPPPEAIPGPVAIPLEILFEDEHMLAINKPCGLVVHPGDGVYGPTLVHAALHATHGKLAPAGGILRPGIVHRLDKETTGVILMAKTDAAHAALVRMFTERVPVKQYLALVLGAPAAPDGHVREPIGRHNVQRTRMTIRPDGKAAWTEWRVEERHSTAAARIRCILHTGRTHQIRVHLAHLGHPILGDTAYGLPRPHPRRFQNFAASNAGGGASANAIGKPSAADNASPHGTSGEPATDAPATAFPSWTMAAGARDFDANACGWPATVAQAMAIARYYTLRGAPETWPATRVMLHAERIALPHPISGVPLEFHVPPPEDFTTFETWLRTNLSPPKL